MTEKERPQEEAPNPPEPPPFDPDPDLIGEMERGENPNQETTKSR
jgi:hypothetical protein